MLMNSKGDEEIAMNVWQSPKYTPRQSVEKVCSWKGGRKKKKKRDSLAQQRSCFAMHVRQRRAHGAN